MPEVVRKFGVTEQTYYRWRRESGGLRTDQAKRPKDLERENARLKRLLADADLDRAILREAASGIGRPFLDACPYGCPSSGASIASRRILIRCLSSARQVMESPS